MIVKYNKLNNWGDKVGPVIFEYISGIKPIKVDVAFKNKNKEDTYLTVGSILQRADIYSIIWGSGFITETSKLKQKPKAIYAVRGPLTGKKLIDQGCVCKVYGDPVLLFSRFYKPNIQKKFKLGIVPHFIDKKSLFLKKFKNDSDVLIIDIQGTINGFIDDICSCDLIASSSLHGIIAADAYKIPSIWIQLSSKVKGNGFKFRDYFSSVKREDIKPLIVDENTQLKDLYNKFTNYKIDINLDLLFDVYPLKEKV